MSELLKYFALTKVQDDSDGLAIATGMATDETPDSDHEIASYPETAEAYRVWSKQSFDSTTAAGQNPSLGNCRLMHGARIAGKVIKIVYQDQQKQIWVEMKACDQEISTMLRDGMVQGFSHAGSYVRRWHKACDTDMPSGNFCPTCRQNVDVTYYPRLVELSAVDKPANPNARFTMVRADGSTELRKFRKGNDVNIKQHLKAAAAHSGRLAKCAKELSAAHEKLGKACEQRADFAGAVVHKSISDAHEAIAAAHNSRVDELSTAANQGPDVWNENADNGDSQKVAKGAGMESFWDKFVYGSAPMPPQSASGGLFSE